MKIHAQTKIADLVKYNKDSIETIASLSKPLEKLRNPLLRKIMASRVTIAEAANIGNCPIDILLDALVSIGFEHDRSTDQISTPQGSIPQWLHQLSSENIVQFDVREIIDEGNDPLKQILRRFKTIKVGQALCIVNSFIPTPLVRLLEKDNTLTFTQTINEKEFHSYFYKENKKEEATINYADNETILYKVSEDEFYQKVALYTEAQILELDVRHLDMPMPMQIILQALPNLNKDGALYIHHKRIPIYLLEEIAQENYIVHLYEADDKNVKILIRSKNI